MKLLLVTLALAAQSSQPAPKPVMKPGGTGADIQAKAVIMVDLEDGALNMSESWTLDNTSGKLVDAEHVKFDIGAARLLRVDEDVPGFRAADDSSGVFATQRIGAGSRTASFAYLKDVSGSSTVLRRQVPVNIETGTLIMPAIDDLRVTANYPMRDRVSEMNGRRFLVYHFDGVPAGATLELTVRGLPSHSTVPRLVAGLAAGGILLWMLITLGQGRARRRETVLGAMSAEARRDRIVRAIELLERDFANETIKEKRYQRRHAELMGELAAVLREIELQSGSPRAAAR